MGWDSTDVSTISPYSEPVPKDRYTLQLLGADVDQLGRLQVRTSIANGEHTGKSIRFSFPNPDEYDWSERAFKRFQLTLGVDSLPGETPVAYLRRVNHVRFSADVEVQDFVNEQTGLAGKSNRVNIFSFRPAA